MEKGIGKSVLSQLSRDLRNRVGKAWSDTYYIPWVKAKELDIILEVLSRLKPSNCLEWGCGYSTIYFPKRISSLQRWISIEHNEAWHSQIASKIADSKISLHFVKPDDPTQAVHVEGDYSGFKRYIELPRTFHLKFDFIFIDGRARVECLKVAYELLTDNGVVIMHDANREEYLVSPPPFQDTLLFIDYRKRRGGVWVGSKNRKISSVLDVAPHKKKWKTHNRIAKLLFLK